MKVALLDRDGTLIWEPPVTKQVDRIDKLRILPEVIQGLKWLRKNGFVLVMVSNQDGLGTRSFPFENFQEVQNELMVRFKRADIEFEAAYFASALSKSRSIYRKPNTGLVARYLRENKADANCSLVIGDRRSDRLFAKKLGMQFIKVTTNSPFPTQRVVHAVCSLRKEAGCQDVKIRRSTPLRKQRRI